MKDLCQKLKVKLIFAEPTGYQEWRLSSVWKSLTSGVIWNSFMAWPDWPHILWQIYTTWSQGMGKISVKDSCIQIFMTFKI